MHSSHSESMRQSVLHGIPRYAKDLEAIKEIEGILKPHFPSLELIVETSSYVAIDTTYVRFVWQWMNHAIVESVLDSTRDTLTGNLSIVRRLYQAGKQSLMIDITYELYTDDPYWSCGQKLMQELELNKQDIVEAITNKAVFGTEVTS